MRKKPLSINGLPLQQLENCYSHEMRPETGPRFALNYRSAGTMDKVVHLFTRVKTLPLYAYRCTQCGYKFEKIQNFSATQETECPKCQGVLERPLTAPRLHFKGAGWYVNDYATKSSEPASESASEKDGKVESVSASADSKAPAKGSETTAAAPAASAPAPASSSSTPAS